MNKKDYYKVYQENLVLLNAEIDMVKTATQQYIGKKAFQEENGAEPAQIAASEKRILAGVRLYAFLICSWFEARLMKILYEESSAAFTDSEIYNICHMSNMLEKWTTTFNMAVCKGFGFSYIAGKNDYSDCFASSTQDHHMQDHQRNYQRVLILFPEIKDAITIRNRLAHGQWSKQFNGRNTSITQYPFFSVYDNIQKLDLLRQCYEHIAEIISAYVVTIDKRSADFDKTIVKKIEVLSDKKKKIQSMDYRKYVLPLAKVYKTKGRNVSGSQLKENQ